MENWICLLKDEKTTKPRSFRKEKRLIKSDIKRDSNATQR